MLNESGNRDALADWLTRDLVGPFNGEEEQIRARPSARYIVGVLHPAFTPQAAEETDEALAAVSDDDEADVDAAYGGMRQSAIGLSFTTSLTATPRVSAQFAEYDKIAAVEAAKSHAARGGQSSTALDDSIDIAGESSDREYVEWRRRLVAREVGLSSPKGAQSLAGQVTVEWRSTVESESRIWTVSLINRRAKNGDAIFQPELRVRLGEDEQFTARPATGSLGDPDEELNELLYRSMPEFAVGHGCAASWNEGDEVREVCTNVMPRYEVPAVIPRSATTAELRMDALAGLKTPEAAARALQPLLDEYAAWIEGQQKGVKSLTGRVRETANRNLKLCRVADDRMRSALKLFATRPDALMAFRFMNRAMADQRRAAVSSAYYRKTGKREPIEEIPQWRPFQLGFILLNLVGVADPTSADRKIVDLLWFPTGGGKTESYLGLAAFAIAYRRLTSGAGRSGFQQGVTVLTRYTLRLLTTQQFERAATLVAACEQLRRLQPERWGRAPMRIGLWVGESATPNTFESAAEKAEEAKRRPNPNQSHPFVLRNCPWCGESLPFPGAFTLDPARRQLRVTCAYGGCPFSKDPGIPAIVIDEQIYREPPEILLATVDKLARLPWVGQAASLFGRASLMCAEHGLFSSTDDHKAHFGASCALAAADSSRGVDLVIQDELHLISGPLGSLVGTYEIGVEFLAGRNGLPPKVVASTATIRSAVDQVRALFGRTQHLFPPPALNAFDSFFAAPADKSELRGRMYMGFAAPGSSMKTALIRTYSSLLAGALALDPVGRLDDYWTLVGYFNSLRELGGAVSFLQDDVPSRLGALARAGDYPERLELQHEELTSRIDSTEIPNRLRRMERPRDSGDALDVLVATNMISVGVDVDRLGLMVVAGQPKGTAEYIQATSRVGRSYPGLVATVYNWTRPRDLSHYERFQSYHSAIYRHVEATSVTPLSPRARDRGLHAVLVAALRLAEVALTGENDASHIAAPRQEAIAKSFLEHFEARASSVDSTEAAAARDQLVRLLDQWVERAQTELAYSRGKGNRLLKPARSEAQDDLVKADPNAWPTLNSLRTVESEHSWFEAR